MLRIKKCPRCGSTRACKCLVFRPIEPTGVSAEEILNHFFNCKIEIPEEAAEKDKMDPVGLFEIKRELRHLSSKRLTQITLARILQLLAAEDKDILMVEELRRRVDGESNCGKED